MQSDFLVDTQISDRVITIRLGGELDLLSAPALERALERLPEVEADLVIVDLRGLKFMDSTGLHLLVQAQQKAHECGRRLALIKGTDQVQRLFQLTGMTEGLTMVDSPDELLEVDQAPGAP